MFPWFWLHLAPRFYFPLSGNVTEDFLTKSFFNSIKQWTGKESIEKKAFEYASYGRQIGLITEVLLSLTDSRIVNDEKSKKSLRDLETIYNKIEEIKSGQSDKNVEDATNFLRELKSSDPQQFDRVLSKLTKQ